MLENELANLVSSGQVQARIDSHAKVLYARLTDARAAAYDNALKFGRVHPKATLDRFLTGLSCSRLSKAMDKKLMGS